ncbi:MAG: RnfABCDGE type electron transport complex subunit G [Bacteroidetes bacterium]|jgi:electron transport complex protein RnfG|nr:MAG: RnfABCDGE type electron transport complex subunit G [Bacteroidota bacterium]UCE69225.1 MAG: RnfABCDGE type electron transport complex subunit G [Flavobacteriaceae bacterium]
MKKKESTLINMVVVLFVTTLVAGLTLGYVNDLTLEPKARARLAKKANALKTVLPAFDNDPVPAVIRVKSGSSRDSIEIYPAFRGNGFAGAAVTGASEKGYSGLVKLMVGFLPDGTINNIEVLEQKETPGLGTKMKGEKFLRQFRGKDPSSFNLKVEKDGGGVDALAGATISTRAFSEATQQAYDIFITHRDSINEQDN